MSALRVRSPRSSLVDPLAEVSDSLRVLCVILVAAEHHGSTKPVPSWASCLAMAEQVYAEAAELTETLP